MEQQPGLLLVHLLPQAIHAALSLWRFLHTDTHNHIATRTHTQNTNRLNKDRILMILSGPFIKEKHEGESEQ